MLEAGSVLTRVKLPPIYTSVPLIAIVLTTPSTPLVTSLLSQLHPPPVQRMIALGLLWVQKPKKLVPTIRPPSYGTIARTASFIWSAGPPRADHLVPSQRAIPAAPVAMCSNAPPAYMSVLMTIKVYTVGNLSKYVY